MADQPGRKADLDKDGIILQDAGKAELDKDGIALEIEESPGPAKEEGTTPNKEPEEHPLRKNDWPSWPSQEQQDFWCSSRPLGFFFTMGTIRRPKRLPI